MGNVVGGISGMSDDQLGARSLETPFDDEVLPVEEIA